MSAPAFVYFDRADESDGVWGIAVMRGDVVIGHIFRANEMYGYHPDRLNALKPAFRDDDLDRLKALIEKRYR
jgi:hypothetical protein